MKVMLCGFSCFSQEKILEVRGLLEAMNLKNHFEKRDVIQVHGLTTSNTGNGQPFAIIYASCREDYDMAVNAINITLRGCARSRMEVSWVKLEATTSI